MALINSMFPAPMNYSRALLSGLIFLIITACDSQAQISPMEKRIEIKTALIEIPAKVTAVPQQSRPLLNLSVEDISFENRKNNEDLFLSDYDRTEKNSVLFNVLSKKELSKKQPEQALNLSGKLLTDKNVDETKSFLESVDGIQINVQGRFN